MVRGRKNSQRLVRVSICAFSVTEIRKSARIHCESSAGSCEIPAEDRDDEDLWGCVVFVGNVRGKRERCARVCGRGYETRGGEREGRGGTEKLKHQEENIRDSRGTAWWLNFAKTVKWPAMNHAPPPAAFLLCFWRPNILRRGSIMPA